MEIVKNKYGFFELLNKPSQEELDLYYSKKYYQESVSSTYKIEYSDSEIQYILNKINQKHLVIQDILGSKLGEFLDVGSGEGFALKYFQELNWSCTGLDFSTFGVEKHNPEQAKHVIVGDIFNNLSKIIRSGKKFDLIWLDNVLEHVINPQQLLIDLRKIIAKDGVLVVEVPNDFSVVQQYVLEKNCVDKEFWVCAPDHLSYFSRDSLANLVHSSGWNTNRFLSDYPIDWDLLSRDTNYIKKPHLGRSSHIKRVEIENLLHSISPHKTNALYEALSALGLGRNITGFFTEQ